MPQASNPQAWNRYAYVANNPLKFSDRSGHCWGIASGLRNTIYEQTCENLDMAGIIVASPDATAEQKAGAVVYIGVAGGAHAALAIGLGGIACGLNPACDAVVGTALGFGASGAGAGPALGQAVQAADTSLSGQAAAIPGGPPVALGLAEVNEQNLLFDFTRNVVPGSKDFSEWYNSGLTTIKSSFGGNFPEQFEQAMNNTSHINFNLTGIDDIGKALQEGGQGWYANPRNMTNTELYNVVNNPDWLAKTTFYLNGSPLSAEEAAKLFGGQ